jgi:hypothetical protein
MNVLALILMASCPMAADPVPAVGVPCNCSQDGTARVEPAVISRPRLFGRLRGWFHHSSTSELFVEGVPVSQAAPARGVSSVPAGVRQTSARLSSTAEPPLAPGVAPNLAALDR